MKRGFTLIELMIVVGLMALLGVAATGGYAALQRGMEERGAVNVVSSFLRAAQERARIDQVPTRVFLYNRMLQEATEDDGAIVCGEAVAIRMTGRISRIEGSYLIDEFSDLGTMFNVVDQKDESDLKSGSSMRLWRFSPNSDKMQYSLVSSAVCLRTLQEVDVTSTEQSPPPLNVQAYAFYDQNKGSKKPSTWAAGHAYGFEFAKIQLPNGYVFGKDLPKEIVEIKEIDSIYFDPKKSPKSDSIEIWSYRQNASARKAGEASAVLTGQ